MKHFNSIKYAIVILVSTLVWGYPESTWSQNIKEKGSTNIYGGVGIGFGPKGFYGGGHFTLIGASSWGGNAMGRLGFHTVKAPANYDPGWTLFGSSDRQLETFFLVAGHFVREFRTGDKSTHAGALFLCQEEPAV